MTTRQTIRPDYDAYPSGSIQLDEKASWLHSLSRFTGSDLAIIGIVLVLVFGEGEQQSLTTCLGLAFIAILGLMASRRSTFTSHAPSAEQLEEAAPESRSERTGAATAR